MYSFDGIGTKIYGKRDENPTDGSYIVTKWFVFLFLPIFPLGSYRVIKIKPQNPGVFTIKIPRYQMAKVARNWDQIRNTYALFWGSVVVIIGLLIAYGKIHI